MNHSGDAAEQIVRMSLGGVEVAAKITGAAAKETALILLAALKNKDKNLKSKGRARLDSMLKSGKALEIFSVKESDLKRFMQGAKQYGIVYCVLRNTKNSPDGLCDIMVKAEDSPKINRLVERFNLATVNKAKVESEVVNEKADKTAKSKTSDIGDTEKLLDDLLGKEQADNRPFSDTPPPKTNPSAPTSANKNKSARGTSSRPSVKEELGDITAAIKEKQANTHKQPIASGKSKNTKARS